MECTIRRATLADLPTIVQFNLGLAWETEGKRLAETTLQHGVRAVLTDPGKGFYTLAEHAGQPLGQTLITTEWSDWRNGYFWWLQSVFVQKDARRHGVFRALFQHLQAAAEADPTVVGFRLYVEKANSRGRQTYHSLGFTDEGYDLMSLYPLARSRC